MLVLKRGCKDAAIIVANIFTAVLPWAIYFYIAYDRFIPTFYVDTFNFFLDYGMGSAHAANIAIISTSLALVIAAVILSLVAYHPIWKKTSRSDINEKAEAQDQA